MAGTGQVGGLTMSRLLLDPEDYERFTGRSFHDDYVVPALKKEAERKARRCAYCGKHDPFTKDHVIPKSRGGSDDKSNLVWCCHSCNSKKWARTPEEAGMPIVYIKESRVK
jgi:5-methylcytosine-specific restriction endonuclease McrA